MKFVFHPNEGERVLLSAPLCGDIQIKSEAPAGSSAVLVLQTLPAGGFLPAHRYLQQPLSIWVSKGQGRVTVEAHAYTVTPGNTITVPAGAWYSLRNTGTGLFQVVWTVPQSLLAFFRALAQAPTDLVALNALGASYGVEFQSETTKAAPSPAPERGGVRRRRQHRPFRHRKSRPAPSKPEASSSAPAAAEMPPAACASRPAIPTSKPNRPDRQLKEAGQRRRKGYIKEVFMGGRWVRVSGEGPVVASGDQ